MKYNHRSLLTFLAVATLASTGFAAEKKIGFVDFGKFTPSSEGREFVEVNVGNNLITMAARLAEKDEPEIAEALRGLEQIRVNVIGLGEDNREEVEQRIKAIRRELDEQGWERIVTAQQKNEDVAVFIKTRGDEAVSGVVVSVLEGGKTAILVNVVGDIKPEKLAVIGERFNVDPLKKLGGKHGRREARADKGSR